MKKKLSQLYYFENYLAKTLFIFVLFVVGLFFVRTFIFSVGVVDGVSMEPNINNNQRFLVNRISYLFDTPKRGDVIQVVDISREKLLVKRIIGLPGEVVVIKNSYIYINDIKLEENYLEQEVMTRLVNKEDKFSVINLKENEYYILGDNREFSRDSRDYGAISRDMIVGSLVFFE